MINENTMAILKLCAVAWALFSVLKSGKTQHLYAIIMFVALLLAQYPFYLPITVSFAIWGIVGTWIAFREARFRSEKFPLRILGAIQIAFTIAFLAKVLLDMDLL